MKSRALIGVFLMLFATTPGAFAAECVGTTEHNHSTIERSTIDVGIGAGLAVFKDLGLEGSVTFSITTSTTITSSFTCSFLDKDGDGAACCPTCVGYEFHEAELPVTLSIEDPLEAQFYYVEKRMATAQIVDSQPSQEIKVRDTTCSVSHTEVATMLSASLGLSLSGAVSVGPISGSVAWGSTVVSFGEQEVCRLQCPSGCLFSPRVSEHPTSIDLIRGVAHRFRLELADGDGSEELVNLASDCTISGVSLDIEYTPGHKDAWVVVAAGEEAPSSDDLCFKVEDRCGEFGTVDIPFEMIDYHPPAAEWVGMERADSNPFICGEDSPGAVITVRISNPRSEIADIGVIFETGSGSAISTGPAQLRDGWTCPTLGGDQPYQTVQLYYCPSPGVVTDTLSVKMKNQSTKEYGAASFPFVFAVPPRAYDDEFHNLADSGLCRASILLDVIANDTDADGEKLRPQVETLPQHGTLELHENGTYTYTPDPGFAGEDRFTYRAADSMFVSDPAMVTLRVYSPPVAVDTSVSFLSDEVGAGDELPSLKHVKLAAVDLDGQFGDVYEFRFDGHPLPQGILVAASEAINQQARTVSATGQHV